MPEFSPTQYAVPLFVVAVLAEMIWSRLRNPEAYEPMDTLVSLGFGLGSTVAGALLGGPADVVACRSVALAVPAQCEIVLEGVLDPDETVEEGPVSEFHGMYERYGAGYVVTFSMLTRRAGAIWQAILPGYAAEHVLIGAVAIAAGLQRGLKGRIPSLRAVAVSGGGAGRLHAVLSLENARPGEARKAMNGQRPAGGYVIEGEAVRETETVVVRRLPE